MKKILILSTALILLASLVACSSSGNSSSTTGSNQTNTTASLSQEMQLLVGTLKLEGTDQAVTADQATQLLPLWQMLMSLETSGTAATEEVNAVVNQIQGTMTSDQMKAITAMNLTREDEMTTMQSLGLNTNLPSGTPQAAGTPGASGSMGFPGDSGAGGNLPSGGAPPSGSMPPSGSSGSGGPGNFQGGSQGSSGSGLDQSQIATLQARGTPQATGSMNGVPQPLLDALINLLEKRAQS